MLTVPFPTGTGNGAIVYAPVTIMNDITVEGTETIVIVGSTPAGVKASFVPGEDSVTLAIYDNDSKYTIIESVGSICM